MNAQPAYPFVPKLSRPRLCSSDELLKRVRCVCDQVAIRAYELFEARAREPSQDWEDWFKAEAEFLRPVQVEVTESPERLVLNANVIGFGEDELQVSIGPTQVIIGGRKEPVSEEGNKVFYIDWAPNEILRLVELPAPVLPDETQMRLHNGLLTIDLPKAKERVLVEFPS